ncbi:hypothetical protein D3C72_2433350 [compost metagenome]
MRRWQVVAETRVCACGRVGCGRFVHLDQEHAHKKCRHAQHEPDADDAHQAVVGGKQVGQQLHGALLIVVPHYHAVG